jgi:predicted outer membrane repeat protein
MANSAVTGSFSSPTFTDCTFSNNYGGYGGAIFASFSSITATRCLFVGNNSLVGDGDGGAICTFNSQLTLTSCEFTRNRARRGSGGALSIDGKAYISLCKFYGNSAYLSGGAIASSADLEVVDSAFVGNVAQSTGGAIDGSFFSVRRSTFTQNRSSNRGGAISSGDSNYQIYGAIFWHDSAYYNNEIYAPQTYDIYGNDIEGGPNGFNSSAYIDVDPLFVRAPWAGFDGKWGTADDDYGNLQLQPYSPCIDMIDPNGFPPVTSESKDLAGNPRVVDFPGPPSIGAYVDLGAYETPAAIVPRCIRFIVDAPQPTLRITFNTDINPATAVIPMVTNLATGQEVLAQHWYEVTFSYDPQTYSLDVIIPAGVLPDGNYRAVYPAGGVQSVTGQPSVVSLPYDFFVLSADANRDRKVDAADLGILSANWQCSGRTFCQGDFNYDGMVDINDLSILVGKWQQTLAPPPLVQPISLALRAPSRTASRLVSSLL